MSRACEVLHERLGSLPRFSKITEALALPTAGIYVLFEKGEKAHDGDRIVRVGTHKSGGDLPRRISEHLAPKATSRSIFRKQIGCCLLAKRGDILWQKYKQPIGVRGKLRDELAPVEKEVTAYLEKNFAFAIIPQKAGSMHTELETKLLSTIAQCEDCGPSKKWLGRHHPFRANFREVGLWNVQNINKQPMTATEASRMPITARAGALS